MESIIQPDTRLVRVTVQSARTPDGYVLTGADLDEAPLTFLIEASGHVAVRDQDGVFLELSFDMDEESLIVEVVSVEQARGLGADEDAAALQGIARHLADLADTAAGALAGDDACLIVAADQRALATIASPGSRAAAVVTIGYLAHHADTYRQELQHRDPALAAAAEKAYLACELALRGPDEPMDLEPLDALETERPAC